MANQLAPLGSSLLNENFNHMSVTRAPKSRHNCGTKALEYRVASAAGTKNCGTDEFLNRTLPKADLSPSVSKYRKSLEARRRWKATHQREIPVKRRRLYLKMKNTWKEEGASAKEGVAYVSGMAPTMERAAEASCLLLTWVPEPTSLAPTCRAVVVDIESTGFSSAAEIVQLAAKCGEKEFNKFIVPQRPFDPKASAVTGMTAEGGKLARYGEILLTVPAQKAVEDFLLFLRTCSAQVVLVGHNFELFDAPRIVRLFAENNLLQQLCSMTFGITDTLPLIKQGKVQKQDLLASTYLKGTYWENLLKKAHDALTDCQLLQGLLEHFQFSEEKLIDLALPIRNFMEKFAANEKKKEYRPALLGMKNYGISDDMIGRMAAEGVTIAALVREYSAHGRQGLNVYLGVQLCGKVRVTKSKRVLDHVESFVKNEIENSVTSP